MDVPKYIPNGKTPIKYQYAVNADGPFDNELLDQIDLLLCGVGL